MSTILLAILKKHTGTSLDIASAYFNVHGFQLIQDGLKELSSFRLMLGFEPHRGEDVGFKPDRNRLLKQMKGDLEGLPYTEDLLLLVEDLIRLLRRESVAVSLYEQGFLHAKAFLFYNDRQSGPGSWDRFEPYVGIVGCCPDI
ncbi:MAG: hypothetical protein ACXABY_19915 [Candidatus Thorarchaeota archaeon]|jgi:hypothetical protein